MRKRRALNSPGVRRDHGRLRHFDYVKPLRRKRRSIGRRDPGGRGAPKQVGDYGCFVQRIDGMPRRGPCVSRGGRHLITDKRHFAGMRAARTRRINRTTERILDIFDDKGMAGVALGDQVRAILEEVL